MRVFTTHQMELHGEGWINLKNIFSCALPNDNGGTVCCVLLMQCSLSRTERGGKLKIIRFWLEWHLFISVSPHRRLCSLLVHNSSLLILNISQTFHALALRVDCCVYIIMNEQGWFLSKWAAGPIMRVNEWGNLLFMFHRIFNIAATTDGRGMKLSRAFSLDWVK